MVACMFYKSKEVKKIDVIFLMSLMSLMTHMSLINDIVTKYDMMT